MDKENSPSRTISHKDFLWKMVIICRLFLSLVLVMILMSSVYASETKLTIEVELQQRILHGFGASAQIGDYNDKAKAWTIRRDNEVAGYLFETSSHVHIPAYSGKPVNLAVALDSKGIFKYAWVIEHHEPILLVGIPESKLNDFAMQYVGHSIDDRIRVSTGKSNGEVNIDAITGATVTVIVVNETIMRAAHKVAIALGLREPAMEEVIPPSKVLMERYSEASWQELIGIGAIRRLKITRAQVDDAFMGTSAGNVDVADEDEKQQIFIDLFYVYLNTPNTGKNLLGDSEYQWLMGKLKPGEHAIALMANGRYSFRGNSFVRGGIFDRVNLSQKGADITFRDLDYYRLSDVFIQDFEPFSEMAIFIIRDHYHFDPGASWDINLLIRRQVGPIHSEFVTFSGSYQIPESYIQRPSQEEINAAKPRPLWVNIWYQKKFQLGILIISLVLLMTIVFLQNWLVTYPKFFHHVRRIYLVYTVAFVGWYGLGQLSVVNVLTFVQALFRDFHWQLFLMDPVIFIIWVFAAVTILLWGRGIYCGWLCPFGALQELINEAARKLKIRQYELPFTVHERLWSVKYLIFLGLFGVSLESMSSAEKLAEVEPFKTSILMMFQREWWFVTYAVILLVISIFTRKVYCRYICPLGAALAIPTKIRLFDWLKRRPECGNPCQLCARECEIQAIHPDGSINANECHHCLDCQVTYGNDKRCPPLVLEKKKGRKLKQTMSQVHQEEIRTEMMNIEKNV